GTRRVSGTRRIYALAGGLETDRRVEDLVTQHRRRRPARPVLGLIALRSAAHGIRIDRRHGPHEDTAPTGQERAFACHELAIPARLRTTPASRVDIVAGDDDPDGHAMHAALRRARLDV